MTTSACQLLTNQRRLGEEWFKGALLWISAKESFVPRLSVLLTLVLVLAVGTFAPAQAVVKPAIGDVPVVHAPIGERGGLMNPVVWCADGRSPKVRTVVTGVDSEFRRVFDYRGSLPGLYFPRVEVGRYKLVTRATCGVTAAWRAETVTVREKTHKRTISRSEFRRIKRGMTVRAVNRIVGYPGTAFSYGSTMSRTYDQMEFWQMATIEFRRGRATGKWWNVGHD